MIQFEEKLEEERLYMFWEHFRECKSNETSGGGDT